MKSNKIRVLPILTILFASMIFIVSQSTTAYGQSFPTGVDLLYKFDTSASSDVSKSMPRGITVAPNGNVYVVAQLDAAVHVYDSSGKFLFKFGSEGTADGEFGQPIDIAIDSSNNLYITDTHNYRIQVFDLSGNFLYKFGTFGYEDGQFHRAYYLAIDSSNNVYVSELQKQQIQVFNSTGNFLFKFGTQGTGNGQFSQYNSPQGIAVDNSGKIYAADNGNNRIQVFDSSGKFLFKFGSGVAGSGDGEFQGIYGIDVDSHGNTYVSDWNNDRIQVFDSSGKFLFDFGSADSNDPELRPLNVYVDDSDKIYVSEDVNKLSGSDKLPSSGANDYNVQVFTLDYTTPTPEPEPEPPGITVNTDKSSYDKEESIQVSGYVTNPIPGTDVGLVVIGPPPFNNIIKIEQIKVQGDNTFSTTLSIAGELWKYDGTYTIRVTYGHLEESIVLIDIKIPDSSTQPEPDPEPNYEPISIFVSTDKSSYKLGESILIYGHVSDKLPGYQVSLQVFEPRFGNQVSLQTFSVGPDKKFSIELTTGGPLWKSDGTYTIKVLYRSESTSATTTFEFSGSGVQLPKPTGHTIVVDRTNFSLSYSINGGSLLNVNPDSDTNSLTITMDATRDGELTIVLPRVLIDAKIGNSDGKFFVIVDGEEVQFEETVTRSDRILTILFPDGAEEIQIIGTLIVPTQPKQEPKPDVNPKPLISVYSYNKNYQYGDTIIISGQVTSVIEYTPVTLQIFHGGNIVAVAQLSVSKDGTFTHTIGALWQNDGKYIVRASYGQSITETNFLFESNEFPIPKKLEPKVDKVTICHYPPGNLDNLQTLRISSNALQTHLSHGDSVGECDTNYNPSIVSDMPNVSTPQETPIVTQVDSSPQNDDRIVGLIEENKNLREELERQGSEIDSINEQVDYLNEIMIQFNVVYEWISSLGTDNLFGFFSGNSEFFSDGFESPVVPPISKIDAPQNKVQEEETMEITETTTKESIKILGYDARDVPELQAHDGTTMLAGSGGVQDGAKTAGERIAVYLQNDSIYKVTIAELRFVETIYVFNGFASTADSYNYGAAPAQGEYVILIQPPGTLLNTLMPEIGPGDIVTILIDLDDNIKIGRDVQFRLETTNGNIVVHTLKIGQQSG